MTTQECIQQKNLSNITLNKLLSSHFDLRFTSKSYIADLLSILVTVTKSEEAQDVLPSRNTALESFAAKAKDALQEYHTSDQSIKLDDLVNHYPTVVHLLEKYRYLLCEPLQIGMRPVLSILDVLSVMPQLKPRQYSISSSNKVSQSTLSLTVKVLNYTTGAGIKVEGLCSHYLAKLKPEKMVNAKVIRSNFKPPSSSSCPIIMIGAGTGLAPFMGFLEERAALMTNNEKPK